MAHLLKKKTQTMKLKQEFLEIPRGRRQRVIQEQRPAEALASAPGVEFESYSLCDSVDEPSVSPLLPCGRSAGHPMSGSYYGICRRDEEARNSAEGVRGARRMRRRGHAASDGVMPSDSSPLREAAVVRVKRRRAPMPPLVRATARRVQRVASVLGRGYGFLLNR